MCTGKLPNRELLIDMATLNITDTAGFEDPVRRLSSSSSLNEGILTELDVLPPLTEFASRSAVWLRVTGNCDVTAIITNADAAIFRVGFNNFQHLTKLNDVNFFPFRGESFKTDAVVSGLEVSADNMWGMR